MMQLIWINLIVIGMDVLLLVMEYENKYNIEATLKAMIYSIKFKLEFAVLNQLMTLANSSVNNVQNIHIHENDQKSPISRMDTKEKSEGYWTTASPKSTGNPPRQKHSTKTH